MAITILQNPETFSPSYNAINFLVSSDKVAQDNFQYVCDIYITGVSSPAYFRIKSTQDPTSTYGIFDVHRVLENYLTSNISKSLYGFQKNANSYVKYTCKFGEEFGLSSSGTTVYANITVASAKYAYNGVIDFLDFQNYDDTNYLISTASSVFLTSLKSKRIRSAMDTWVHMMVNVAGKANRMIILAIDSNGSATTTKISNAFTAISDEDSRFLRFSAGPQNINLISSGDIISGSQPIITTNTALYRIYTADSSDTPTSEILTFTIDDTCTKNDVYILHFLNKLGGFDSFMFIRASRDKSEATKSNYKKPAGAISGATYGYNKSDKGTTQFDTLIKDKIELQSDWLTDAESVWLEELVNSPEIYLDDSTHGLVAVNIVETQYEKRKVENDKTFNLKITIQYSFDRYRQRG